MLTLDEAIALFGPSAMLVADLLSCDLDALRRVLRGGRAPTGLTASERRSVQAHRRIVMHVIRAGRSEILDDQIDGVISYIEYARAHTPGIASVA